MSHRPEPIPSSTSQREASRPARQHPSEAVSTYLSHHPPDKHSRTDARPNRTVSACGPVSLTHLPPRHLHGGPGRLLGATGSGGNKASNVNKNHPSHQEMPLPAPPPRSGRRPTHPAWRSLWGRASTHTLRARTSRDWREGSAMMGRWSFRRGGPPMGAIAGYAGGPMRRYDFYLSSYGPGVGRIPSPRSSETLTLHRASHHFSSE